MNTLTFTLLAMVAVAAAAPQYGGYGHGNYFFGKRSTNQAMKKGMRRNANMSKYLSKIPKPNVNLDMKNDAKTNGFALIIPNKKILITVRTKNGNQPLRDAKIFM